MEETKPNIEEKEGATVQGVEVLKDEIDSSSALHP